MNFQQNGVAPIEQAQTLGLQALDILRSEEEPWLLDVFEAPSEFDLICGPRSAIVFGEPGSGKTAICRVLTVLSETPDGRRNRLLVEWRPQPPKAAATVDSALVEEQLREILDSCAFQLLTYLAQHPELFYESLEWVQDSLVWFIRTYTRGELRIRVGSLQREVGEKGYSLLLELLVRPVRVILEGDVGPEYVIRELLKALEELKLTSVWVLVDNLDIWSEAAPEPLSQALTAFLSALALFEQSGFAYKIFLPSTLERNLAGVSGITRRRVSVHYLRWTTAKLTQLLLRRLQVAIDAKVTTLAQICTDPNLVAWLERCGGNTPAGWLEYARPLVAAYLDRQRNGDTAPISEAEWLEIRRRNPPKLSLDRTTQRVRVGERISKELTEQQFALFEYLYKNAGETCTRSQLHYLADLKLPSEPRPGDDFYEAPKDYGGQLETAIWRLRDAIEPAPQHPFFIITVKGKGYRLENVFKP
jgi:hypothetical protein